METTYRHKHFFFTCGFTDIHITNKMVSNPHTKNKNTKIGQSNGFTNKQ